MFCAKTPILAFAASFLASCTQVTLDIQTLPRGGYVTEIGTGAVIGIAPTVAYYDKSTLNLHKNYKGCPVVKGLQVVWVSGAKTEVPTIELCGNHSEFHITINRPEADGLDKDLNFAVQLEMLQAQRDIVDAAKTANFLQLFQTYQQNQPKTVNCTSKERFDGSVDTTCF